MGQDRAPGGRFAFWWAYVEACRSLATDAGVRMRTFDRALWQFSKERQPAKSRAAADDTAAAAPSPGDAGETKSSAMRRLFAEGRTVSEVAAALNVDYSFAYGVRKRSRARCASKRGPWPPATGGHSPLARPTTEGLP